MTPATDDRPMLTVRDLAVWLNIHPRTLRRKLSAGELPKPIRLFKRGLRWRRATIEHWLQEQEAQR